MLCCNHLTIKGHKLLTVFIYFKFFTPKDATLTEKCENVALNTPSRTSRVNNQD